MLDSSRPARPSEPRRQQRLSKQLRLRGDPLAGLEGRTEEGVLPGWTGHVMLGCRGCPVSADGETTLGRPGSCSSDCNRLALA